MGGGSSAARARERREIQEMREQAEESFQAAHVHVPSEDARKAKTEDADEKPKIDWDDIQEPVKLTAEQSEQRGCLHRKYLSNDRNESNEITLNH